MTRKKPQAQQGESGLAVELRPTASITPYARNPRVNDPAVDAVAASIREFGFRQAIVIDAAGVIVVGHTRWKAARKLGLAKVPVHVARDLTATQAKAYRIADNKTAGLATWDAELLPLELNDLKAADFDLKLMGFTDAELDQLLQPATPIGLTDPDAIPEPPKKAITKPGDLWLLGEHRVLCGDSTKADDVEGLMGGEKADFIFTDPPYGHNNNDGDLIHNREKALGRPETKSSAARPIVNDSPDDAAKLYTAFLHLANDLLRGGGCCCCCCCCGGGGPDPQFGRWSLEMDKIIGFKMAVV